VLDRTDVVGNGSGRAKMTITDGAIMFGFCVLSFVIGYVIGAFRLSRFIGRELHKVHVELERHSQGLQQFYSKLECVDEPKSEVAGPSSSSPPARAV